MTSTLPVYDSIPWTVIDADINIPSKVLISIDTRQKNDCTGNFQLSEMYCPTHSRPELTIS